jgi:hypothetical protein
MSTTRFPKLFLWNWGKFMRNFREFLPGIKINLNFNLRLNKFRPINGRILDLQGSWNELGKTPISEMEFIEKLRQKCQISSALNDVACTRTKLAIRSLISKLPWWPVGIFENYVILEKFEIWEKLGIFPYMTWRPHGSDMVVMWKK